MGKWTPIEKGLPEKAGNVWVTHIEDGVKKVSKDYYILQIKEFLLAKDALAWMMPEEPEPYDESEENEG